MNLRPRSDNFPPLSFRGQLRPSQAAVVKIAEQKLADGAKQLHIVAPPGSGKTILGLYLWAECVRQPAVVLSPNSAIQAQWAAKIDQFAYDAGDVPSDWISTSSEKPALLTSLTYQALTMPGRGSDDLDEQARNLWLERLIGSAQAQTPEEARYWLADLKKHNRDYYDQRLGAYRKQARDAMAIAGDALQTLHVSALDTLARLRDQGIGLVIVDECHHLLGHWGRVLEAAQDLLAGPIVIALTATPPDRDGKLPADVQRYDRYLGEIDYEVPVPAVVKDGFLAPYQDLAYFVRPAPDELSFIANADEQLHTIVEELCLPLDTSDSTVVAEEKSTRSASENVTARGVSQGELPPDPDTENESTDTEEEPPDEDFISVKSPAAKTDATPQPPARESLPEWLLRILVEKRLPTGVAKDWNAFAKRDPDLAWAARIFLLRRRIALPQDVPLPEEDVSPEEVPEMEWLAPVLDRYVRHRLRRSKDTRDHALAQQIIQRLRMLGIQITDTGWQPCASPVGRVMAYSKAKCAAIPIILKTEHQLLGDKLRAVVIADYEKTSATAGSVDNLLDAEAGGAIAAFKSLTKDPATDALNPVLLTGSSVLVDDDIGLDLKIACEAWLDKEKYQVELELGEEEGFHALRGRGKDWTPRVYVEMITEMFQRGISRCLVGTRGLLGEGWDANKINCLIDLTTVTTSMTVNQLRGRSIRLDPAEPLKVANNWDVVCLAPEFSKGLDDYRRFRLKHQRLYGVTDDGAVEKGVGHVHPAFTQLRPEGLEGSTSLLNAEMLERAARRQTCRNLWQVGKPYRNQPLRTLEVKLSKEPGSDEFPPFKGSKQPWTTQSLAQTIGLAVLNSLVEARLFTDPVIASTPQAVERVGGYVRVFLEEANEEDSRLFTQALHEALGPLHEPRYVIPRQIDRVEATWLSRLLPSIVGQYFQRRQREQAMLHAVPSVLARNKELVAIYERYWNQHVSPGEAIFALRGSGEDLLQSARQQGLAPSGFIHEKDVFL
ncbi:DEAD/DEAH box helicase [Anatilimnocola floriformis]|uniref:DEAD/DEAH box helicase n=1 Tax=Anatilimnocola floriformis TaxID=2948575 RepID=UPI0020C3E63D|nr:DEAD/DEAH box helicase family protein [Anatilimnocola floriformis]